MIKSCVSLLAGAYALHFTSFASDNVLIPVAGLGAVIVCLAGGCRAALWFVVGLMLFAAHTLHVAGTRLAADYEGDSILTVLEVVDFPRRKGGSISFLARALDDPRLPPRLRLSWFEPVVLPEVGDVWKLEVRLRRPRSTSNPGTFDYETWLFRQRVGATGYVVEGRRNQRLRRQAGDRLSRLRYRIVERLASVIGDADTAAVAAAITVGTRHDISAEAWSRYSRSGTSHLMAISGLHVGLAASAAWLLVFAGCALLRLDGNHMAIAWIGALLAAAGYAGLSGFAVPARRATLMLSLVAIAFLRAREARPVAILAAVCLVVTAGDPLATLAPGFQLSFAAVLLLLWFARRRAVVASGSRLARVWRGAVQLAAVQVFLLFGLLPLTVANFGRVSFVAPVVNLVAVPMFSVVTVPLALLGVLLDGPVAEVGDAALRIAAASIDLLQWLIDRALSVPGGALSTATASAVHGVYLVSVLAWVVLPRAWPGRHVALLATLALASDRVAGPPAGCADVRMLDVGQGLAVVVRTRQGTMLYDTGAAFRGGSDMASLVVLPYLAANGIQRIDRLVVSHSDIDHAGGTGRILGNMHVGGLLAGEPAPLAAVGAVPCRTGEGWRWDGVAFRVLYPSRESLQAGNDSSCVILVEAGDARLLLTGDIGAGVERLLVSSGTVGHVDAVVVPHHGSNTSSSASFVRLVSAQLALVSTGYRNRWNLPKPEVVQRWRDGGAVVLATAREGAIGVRLCNRAGIVSLSRNRERSRRIWHEPATP